MQLMTGFSQMSRLWSRTTKASYGLMTREMRSSLVSGLFFGSPALVFLFQGHKLESKFVTLSMAHTIRLRSRQELTCANNSQLAQPPNNACVQESGIQRCHQRLPPSQNTNKPGRIRYLVRSEESACVAWRFGLKIHSVAPLLGAARSICAEISCPTSTQAELRTWPYYLLILTAIISPAWVLIHALVFWFTEIWNWVYRVSCHNRLKRPFWPVNRKYQQVLRELLRGSGSRVMFVSHFFCIAVEQAFWDAYPSLMHHVVVIRWEKQF